MNLEDQITRKKELEEKMQALQREIQEIQTTQKKPVLASIIDSMVEFDISIDEVNQALQQRTGTRSSMVNRKLGPAPAKYRHPKTGQTWTGRGKAPRWLVDLEEEEGKPRDTFLIERAAS